jgi:hypothetical protein
MHLERSELKLLAKSVIISGAIAASIPFILWLSSQVAKGAGGPDGLSSPGAVIMFFVVLALGTLVLPWRPFFGWGFLYSNWAWFAAADCLIIGLICGLWAVRRQRRDNLPQNSATSENPF